MTRAATLMAVIGLFGAPAAVAEPDPPAPGPVIAPAEATGPAAPSIAPAAVTQPGTDPGAAVPPVDDGKVVSAPPVSTTTPDGWKLTVSSKDESQRAVAPLTTAISTREYAVGGVFNGNLEGPDGESAKGVFEVGYQIGCGIDMSTSNGVSLTGTAGLNPSIGYFGFDFPGVLPDGILPGIGANIGGGVTVGLKPGIINTVPVTKKAYKSTAPWVSINNFRVKIDGCVGESFIRSYAILTKSTDSGDAILSWYGVTKQV